MLRQDSNTSDEPIIICPRDDTPCESSVCKRRGKANQNCVNDAHRAAQRVADRERRGDPQRFTLTGVMCRYVPDGEGGTEPIWSLPDIDPPMEQSERVEVVEAAAYDELRALFLLTLPWFGYLGPPAELREKVDAMAAKLDAEVRDAA